MTNVERIVAFMLWKSNMLLKQFGDKVPGVYFNEVDAMDIETWPKESIERVTDVLTFYKERHRNVTDAGMCPFCIINSAHGKISYNIAPSKPYCEECGYGARHGICFESESYYSNLKFQAWKLGRGDRSIIHIMGRGRIVDKLEELFGGDQCR